MKASKITIVLMIVAFFASIAILRAPIRAEAADPFVFFDNGNGNVVVFPAGTVVSTTPIENGVVYYIDGFAPFYAQPGLLFITYTYEKSSGECEEYSMSHPSGYDRDYEDLLVY